MSSLSDQVARETLEGQVIYPDRLPKTRGTIAEWSAVGFIILMMLVASWMNMGYGDALLTLFRSEECKSFFESIIHISQFTAFYIVAAFVGELLRRIFLLFEEKRHVLGRYDGDFTALLKDLFTFRYNTQIVVVISTAIVLWYFIKTGSLPWNRSPVVQFMLFIVAYIFLKLLHLDQSELDDNIQMELMQPLDYGSGMALNFFYGYLHIVLPSKGDKEKGLKERIQDYMDHHQLTDRDFPVKKLFILVPASTFVPPNLEDVSFGWMEPAANLEKQVLNRAGVICRSYKNSVYKIQDPNGSDPPIYVAAEGATPVKTLYEAVQHSGKKKEFLKKHQKQIILSFYETLRRTLREHRDCVDLCEFVYYMDVDEHNNSNVNAAKKILDRIEEIKQKENELQRRREGS